MFIKAVIPNLERFDKTNALAITLIKLLEYFRKLIIDHHFVQVAVQVVPCGGRTTSEYNYETI